MIAPLCLNTRIVRAFLVLILLSARVLELTAGSAVAATITTSCTTLAILAALLMLLDWQRILPLP